MKCISIPECTQRSRHLFIGGQHGQESYEEGSQEDRQEGSEERCEEDREEDQEGRQEEVTSSATIDAGGNAGDVTRALTTICFSKRILIAALVDERGCRRDIRSNGWIDFRESSLFQNRSGRRNKFSSFGAESLLRNFAGPKARLKSGPDVFADALVPRNASCSPERPALRSPGLWCPALSKSPGFLS